jgi:putative transposase
MEIYHVLNRGVDKRTVVLDDSDRLRFVHSLFVFNDAKRLDENHRKAGVALSASDRKPLVHIHAWCLMDNHYHLLVSPVGDDLKNLSKFMKKLNMGYARYFNERHERSGYLWQGKYKKIHIEQDAHFLYIPYYIHLNPLDFALKEWRTGEVQDINEAMKLLVDYRWSSYLDYNGTKNFPSIITKDILAQILSDGDNQNIQISKIITTADLSQDASLIE